MVYIEYFFFCVKKQKPFILFPVNFSCCEIFFFKFSIIKWMCKNKKMDISLWKTASQSKECPFDVHHCYFFLNQLLVIVNVNVHMNGVFSIPCWIGQCILQCHSSWLNFLRFSARLTGVFINVVTHGYIFSQFPAGLANVCSSLDWFAEVSGTIFEECRTS